MIKLFIYFEDGTDRESALFFDSEPEAMDEYYAWHEGEGFCQDYFGEIEGFDLEYIDDEAL